MNRKKKIKQTFKKLLKKENAKKQPKNKERYISKADRAKLALEEEQQNEQGVDEGTEQITEKSEQQQ